MASSGSAAAGSTGQMTYCRVALDVPLAGPFDYAVHEPVGLGDRVIVPFGRRRLIGVVLQVDVVPDMPLEQVRPVEQVLRDLASLPQNWLALTEFAAKYYQRPVGEVMLPALPVQLRRVSSYEGKRAGLEGPLARHRSRQAKQVTKSAPQSVQPAPALSLNSQQQAAVDQVTCARGFKPFLLFGVTGSGKTQVYLAAAHAVLARGGRVLFLVPEINLTPQFAKALEQRLAAVVQPDQVALLHSRLADGQRLAAWLEAFEGRARVLLGTRSALFTPMPGLDLIVVDEEHDPSYKQQEGLRYSARDLALWRARQEGAVVVLGSATPSLETWRHAQRGDYQLLRLDQRATEAVLPTIELIDTRRLQLNKGLAPQLIEAIGQALAQSRQVLIYLNRRGYAPVLHCDSCGWVSQCDHCTAYSVVHRVSGHYMRLHCHHCGAQRRAPEACPDCGDPDIKPMGQGTQRLEQHLAELFEQATIVRIDADSTRRKGSAQALFDQVHDGRADILVGTQMVSKGHDFTNLGLVGVLNADSMLFSQDFRAPERLFAQLMQVAGRAGRDGQSGLVMIQTGYPEQPLYQALKNHDYEGFAQSLMQERAEAGLPPHSFQALMTAQGPELQDVLAFLQTVRASAQTWLQANGLADAVMLYDPVPLRVVRVAKVCRAQLLMEAPVRAALHRLLQLWLPSVGHRHATRNLSWQLEVDPLEI